MVIGSVVHGDDGKPKKKDGTVEAVDWDEQEGNYVLTTRTYPGQRAIGLLRTPSWPSATEATETLTQVEAGNAHHQLYSQITFRFYDIWLGLVMVFDADNAVREKQQQRGHF